MLGGCTTGNVKATPGFCLLARYVFHAVGPTANEPFQLLASWWSQKPRGTCSRVDSRSKWMPPNTSQCGVWGPGMGVTSAVAMVAAVCVAGGVAEDAVHLVIWREWHPTNTLSLRNHITEKRCKYEKTKSGAVDISRKHYGRMSYLNFTYSATVSEHGVRTAAPA